MPQNARHHLINIEKVQGVQSKMHPQKYIILPLWHTCKVGIVPIWCITNNLYSLSFFSFSCERNYSCMNRKEPHQLILHSALQSPTYFFRWTGSVSKCTRCKCLVKIINRIWGEKSVNQGLLVWMLGQASSVCDYKYRLSTTSLNLNGVCVIQ